MDLKDIIKWFIPCFHILLTKMDVKLFLISMFLLFNFCATEAQVNSVSEMLESTKNVDFNLNELSVKQNKKYSSFDDEARSMEDTSVGRTFGRPVKKLAAALIPLAFQIGAASTWTVVAALVGVKTLLVTLFILKLLLVAGAAKIGALFASKTSHSHHQEWTPQKEIHLHIHNPHSPHEEHVPITSWSRDGVTQNINAFNPYQGGPQTISTPFGNYVKIER